MEARLQVPRLQSVLQRRDGLFANGLELQRRLRTSGRLEQLLFQRLQTPSPLKSRFPQWNRADDGNVSSQVVLVSWRHEQFDELGVLGVGHPFLGATIEGVEPQINCVADDAGRFDGYIVAEN